MLNGLGLLIGLVIVSFVVRDAERRERVSKNLFHGEQAESRLERSVGEVRAELGLA